MDAFLLSAAAKLLLAPAYYSTDFDVHRNWLALTWSLPCAQWYVDATSQWTLDYPPLFAAFEWLLARAAAVLVEPAALVVTKEPYASWAMTVFHRCSVIAADVVLYIGVVAVVTWRRAPRAASKAQLRHGTSSITHSATSSDEPGDGSSAAVDACGAIAAPWSALLTLALLTHPGLVIVDHVHFQYNGLLLGVLLLCLSCLQWVCRLASLLLETGGLLTNRVLPVVALGQGRTVAATVLFATLLCLKHTFVFAAPVFVVFALRRLSVRGLVSAAALSLAGTAQSMQPLCPVASCAHTRAHCA